MDDFEEFLGRVGRRWQRDVDSADDWYEKEMRRGLPWEEDD
jgi:hypothetical protein